MLRQDARFAGRLPLLAVSLLAASTGVLAPTAARAHFILQQPANWAAQNADGLPLKSPPCGQADTGIPAVPTNMVTAVRKGDQLSITINEVIFHPGHYRIAIAADQNSLPADPPVTPTNTDPCDSTVITANPTLPLLADGVFLHTTPFVNDMGAAAPQTTQVTIPANLPCTHCTLQVVEFMSDHGLNPQGGCFYHHCANITVEDADAGTPPDARMSIPDASVPPDAATPPPTHSGCMVGLGGAASAAGLAPLLAFVSLLLRRRRR